jgi:TonB family protein
MASLVAQCRTALGLKNVSILCSSQAPGPVAMGFRRSVIILPEELFQASPSGDLTAALCHEMAHIRRHDYLLNLICEFILLPVAFHPAAWLVKRRIDESRELACDEAAAGRLVSVSAYARSLLSLARTMSALTSLSRPRYTMGVFDADILEERIMRLLEKRPRLRARRARLLLGGAALALTLAGLAACAFSFTAQENATAQALAAQASNPSADFSGRWELDKAKSDLPSPAPDNLVQVIEQRGSDLKISTTSKDWNTDKPIAVTLFALMMPELAITTDNRESVQPYGPGQMRAKSHWEDSRLITDWTLEREGQVMVTGQWVRHLSKDGKTQTVEITAHDPNRHLDGEAKAVFVKAESATMPGGPAGGVVGGVKGGVVGGTVGVVGGVVGGVPTEGEQETMGLSGTVSDRSGARVPNAIVAIDGDAGFKKMAATNEAGEFSFTGLPDGRYELQVVHDGLALFQQALVLSHGSVRSSGGPLGGRLKLGLPEGPAEYQGKAHALGPGAASPRIDMVLEPSPAGTVSAASGAQAASLTGVPELKLERRVEPVYPPLAKQAGIEGNVVLDVTVDADGTVSNIKVDSGPPVLVMAALEAVQQWKYAASPELPATITVTLPFRLPKGEAGGGVAGIKGGVTGGVIGGVPTQQGKKTWGLSGTVSDPSGARVPNAIISLHCDSGAKKTVATSDAGEFSFTEIPLGSCEWKAFHDGFEVSKGTWVVHKNSAEYQGGSYTLGPGATSPRLDIVLELSSATQSMVVTAKAPPQVVEKRHAAAPKRIRVGGQVQETKVLTKVPPKYPETAQARGVEGVVLIEAVISIEGVPLSLHVLESPDPELSEAALAAVRQWRYQPTLLNGEPIEVVTTISIAFRLES